MGHIKEFYNWCAKKNAQILEYPYDQKVIDSDDALEHLAQYFAKIIKETNSKSFCLIGVSLGATLSLRINEILDNKATKIIMMAPGGLKVARARREMITHAIHNMDQEEFIRKALGIDGLDSFLSHFNSNTEIANDYYPIINSFWSSIINLTQGDAFKKMAIDALNVNYEHLIEVYQDKIHLLWGEQDKIFSMRHFRKFQKKLPATQIELYNNVGHYLPIEAPEHLDKIINSYVFNI
jgi:pimeloyl-ACP methyl ester carboxylesterase